MVNLAENLLKSRIRSVSFRYSLPGYRVVTIDRGFMKCAAKGGTFSGIELDHGWQFVGTYTATVINFEMTNGSEHALQGRVFVNEDGGNGWMRYIRQPTGFPRFRYKIMWFAWDLSDGVGMTFDPDAEHSSLEHNE